MARMRSATEGKGEGGGGGARGKRGEGGEGGKGEGMGAMQLLVCRYIMGRQHSFWHSLHCCAGHPILGNLHTFHH